MQFRAELSDLLITASVRATRRGMTAAGQYELFIFFQTA
jgi:hypothetical protein